VALSRLGIWDTLLDLLQGLIYVAHFIILGMHVDKFSKISSIFKIYLHACMRFFPPCVLPIIFLGSIGNAHNARSRWVIICFASFFFPSCAIKLLSPSQGDPERWVELPNQAGTRARWWCSQVLPLCTFDQLWSNDSGPLLQYFWAGSKWNFPSLY
jgi:hypothetical protein